MKESLMKAHLLLPVGDAHYPNAFKHCDECLLSAKFGSLTPIKIGVRSEKLSYLTHPIVDLKMRHARKFFYIVRN